MQKLTSRAPSHELPFAEPSRLRPSAPQRNPGAGARVLILCLLVTALTLPAAARKERHEKKAKKHETSALWNDPGDIKSRDLFYGPGGKEHEPHGPMKFDQEDMKGTNPKFDLIDEHGTKWRAKLGVEAKPETAAVRLLWAVGYFADADYFLPELKVEGMPPLARGSQWVDPDGTVRNVRLKYRPEKKEGTWQWKHNPFESTRELNGLRVMMALMNNWDLKDENNGIYKDKGSGLETYLVTDVGASFGTSGYHYYGGWSKGNPAAYSHSTFISHIHKNYVDFHCPSHPPFLYFIALHHLIPFLKERSVTKGIPRDDAKWIGGLLSQLTPQQIRDAFRASGYSDAEIDILAGVLRDRIAQLNQL